LTMKLAIMQPYLFPYIGYFQLINAVDTFVIYDDVNYITRGWINRNRILVNGKAQLFTMPLVKASPHKYIKDITLHDLPIWKGKFLKTLNLHYRKAPFFQDTFSLVKKVFACNSLSLADFLTVSLRLLCEHLEIRVNIVRSSAQYDNTELKGMARIIDICQQVEAEVYINPIGGSGLYSKQDFKKNGIVLKFLESEQFSYDQFGAEFIPWLSIIDVLMFNDRAMVRKVLDRYRLH